MQYQIADQHGVKQGSPLHRSSSNVGMPVNVMLSDPLGLKLRIGHDVRQAPAFLVPYVLHAAAL